MLDEAGITLTERDYYERYLGYDDLGVFQAVDQRHRLALDGDRLGELVAQKAARMERLERDQGVLFPGAAAAIARCAAVVPLAIASGALRVEIERVLNGTGLSRFFAAIVAAEDTAAGKPAPDPYVRAVGLLSETTAPRPPLSAGECIAVEDSHWGIRSARAAGLTVVAVAHTYPAAALGEADLVLDSIAALDLERLGRLCPADPRLPAHGETRYPGSK